MDVEVAQAKQELEQKTKDRRKAKPEEIEAAKAALAVVEKSARKAQNKLEQEIVAEKTAK